MYADLDRNGHHHTVPFEDIVGAHLYSVRARGACTGRVSEPLFFGDAPIPVGRSRATRNQTTDEHAGSPNLIISYGKES